MNKPALLAVDDDPAVLAAVRRDLRNKYRDRYTIVGATSGPEALEAVRELKKRGDALAMIVSDQRMPAMTGTELLARSREFFPNAKRVLLTAYSDIEAAVRAINEAHLDHYLSKPWEPPEDRLYPVVDELLDEWEAERPPESKGLRLIGDQWSPRSHEVKDFLAASLIPYRWLDIARDPEAGVLMSASGIAANELPVLILEDGAVLRDLEPRTVAERLGHVVSAQLDLYDLVIVGAGPAGLAAAVYGASEGLKTLLVDRHAAGGQAGSSSKIENYLGFPNGVTGQELTRRALAQVRRLGAEFIAPLEVTGVTFQAGQKRVCFANGREIATRTLLVATGMSYREHPAPGVREHTGAGVYYGAAMTEAPALAGRRVLIAGGGNSAGQGAMYLARHAKEVEIVIRRESLKESMSQYLIEQIAKTPNIRVRSMTEIDRVEGNGRVERVTLKSLADGSCRSDEADALFVFIGTKPRSEWLPSNVILDEKGFVLTGAALRTSEAFARTWKESREPLLLETSVPGIFAAGDVRAGAMNRVASAVGEGSTVVRLAHEYLART